MPEAERLHVKWAVNGEEKLRGQLRNFWNNPVSAKDIILRYTRKLEIKGVHLFCGPAINFHNTVYLGIELGRLDGVYC